MGNWLDDLREALESSSRPVDFFFRDDDAGRRNDRLWALLDLFAEYELPVDLAVIPQALDPALAKRLNARSSQRVRCHQHGFAHMNHEPVGRKCEFGPSRSHAQQRHDIAAGKDHLEGLLGPMADPMFTPPWNRCTALTGRCLVELGFKVLSREARAAALSLPGLSELPVRVDWFAHHKRVRLTPDELGGLLADAVRASGPVGVMFHHELMDRDERAAARELFALLAGHSRARTRPMCALAGGPR